MTNEPNDNSATLKNPHNTSLHIIRENPRNPRFPFYAKRTQFQTQPNRHK